MLGEGRNAFLHQGDVLGLNTYDDYTGVTVCVFLPDAPEGG